jgi:thioredoxin-related protein
MNPTFKLAALVSFAAALTIPQAHAKPPAEWQFKTLPEAITQSETENKPLLIMFGFEKCTWCDYLYNAGMNSESLRKEYQGAVALAYYDTRVPKADDIVNLPAGATIKHADFIKQYRAYPTPSWIFISPKGQILHGNNNGKTTTREMRRDLEVALKKMP